MSFNYHPGFIPSHDQMAYATKKIEVMADNLDIEALKVKLYDSIFYLSNLIDLIHTKKIAFPFWKLPIESLLVKFNFHSSAIGQLSNAIPIFKRTDGEVVNRFDIGSLYIISRSQIECFLTVDYLIFAPKNDEDGHFRNVLYRMSGLANRQKYIVTLPENLLKKEKENKELTALRKELLNHTLFTNLTKGLKNRIEGESPPARLFGWVDLIRMSRLRNDIFEDTWKLYSNHAHSEFIGAIQLESYIMDIRKCQQNVYHIVEAAIMLVCITITELLNLLPELIEDYERIVPQSDKYYIFNWALLGLERNH